MAFALQPRIAKQTKKQETVETTAFTLEEAIKPFVDELKVRIAKLLADPPSTATMPGNIGWVVVKGKPLFFLMEHLHSGSATHQESGNGSVRSPVTRSDIPPLSAIDFAEAFRHAFERIDRNTGSRNFVKLADLRRVLSEFSRDEFDAGLQRLRLAREFTLDSHEGLHGTLTMEEREAGVRDGGSLLVYACRR